MLGSPQGQGEVEALEKMEVDSSVRTDVLCVIAAGDGSKAALSAFDHLIRTSAPAA